MYHGNNILELSLSDPKKFGSYAPAVKIMLETVKAVINGIKNETDPDVLLNSITGEQPVETMLTALATTYNTESAKIVKLLGVLSDNVSSLSDNISSLTKIVADSHPASANNLNPPNFTATPTNY